MTIVEEARTSAGQPEVFIEAAHYDRLHALATMSLARSPEAARILLEEIERADILEEAAPQPRVVTMGAKVTFRDDDAGRRKTVRVVYPGEADIAKRKISVLTPIGAALIGLQEGSRFSWKTQDGALRSLTVIEVGRR